MEEDAENDDDREDTEGDEGGKGDNDGSSSSTTISTTTTTTTPGNSSRSSESGGSSSSSTAAATLPQPLENPYVTRARDLLPEGQTESQPAPVVLQADEVHCGSLHSIATLDHSETVEVTFSFAKFMPRRLVLRVVYRNHEGLRLRAAGSRTQLSLYSRSVIAWSWKNSTGVLCFNMAEAPKQQQATFPAGASTKAGTLQEVPPPGLIERPSGTSSSMATPSSPHQLRIVVSAGSEQAKLLQHAMSECERFLGQGWRDMKQEGDLHPPLS